MQELGGKSKFQDLESGNAAGNGEGQNGGKGSSGDAAADLGSAPLPSDERTTTPLQAFFHIVKGNVGAGIFLLPMTYNNAGYVMGPILAAVTGLVAVECTLMLVKRKVEIGKEHINSFTDVASHDLGPRVGSAVTVALILTQFGFCCMYLQFASGLLFNLWTMPYVVWVLICLAVVTPLTWVRSLSTLAPASAFASLCVVYCIVSVLAYCVPRVGDADSSLTVAVAPVTRWPTFIAANMAVLEGIGVVLPVENTLEQPDQFPPLLRGTIVGILVTYFFFSLMCYIPFGTTLNTSIVHALPSSGWGQTVQLALAVALLLSFPIQYIPAIQLLRADALMRLEDSVWRPRVFKLIINVLLAGVAAAVGPETLGIMLSIVGSLGATFLATIVPAWLTIMTVDKMSFAWWKCVACIVFGVLVSLFGTVATLFDIDDRLAHHKVHEDTSFNSFAFSLW